MDAVNKYGYDPKEIVAALILLHNNTSPLRRKRQGIQDEDLERLHDIAVRRYIQQRQYEEANGGRRSPRDTTPVELPSTTKYPCVWCAEETGSQDKPICEQCEAGNA